jgi:REP element-mobilizing transposase RayT
MEVQIMRRIKRDPVGWHVINRATRRLDLYQDEQDFSTFLAILSNALTASETTLWAMTLMSNHYHLVLYAGSDQLSDCMHRVNREYSRYHNGRYHMVGHSFEGPYKAYAQPTPFLLLRTIAYVFMNPVAAGLTSRPEDYRWSTVRDYLDIPGSAFRVNPADVMNRVSNEPSQAWSSFHHAMDRELNRPRRRSNGLTRTEVHAQQFEWLLEHARESIPTLEGEDPVDMAIYWARQCGVAPKAIATVLEDQSPKQIGYRYSRIAAKMAEDPDRAKRMTLP